VSAPVAEKRRPMPQQLDSMVSTVKPGTRAEAPARTRFERARNDFLMAVAVHQRFPRRRRRVAVAGGPASGLANPGNSSKQQGGVRA